jgi:hypothetical protein
MRLFTCSALVAAGSKGQVILIGLDRFSGLLEALVADGQREMEAGFARRQSNRLLQRLDRGLLLPHPV